MHICVFSTVTYWHGLRGGMDLHGKHLLEGLARKGHRVTVVCTRHPSGRQYDEMGDIRIHYLKNTTFGSSRGGWKRESVQKLEEILETDTVDIVLSQSGAGYGAAKVARQEGIPFATIMHGYETMIFWSVLNQVRNFKSGLSEVAKSLVSTLYYTITQEYRVLVNSSLIIAVSENVARTFMA